METIGQDDDICGIFDAGFVAHARRGDLTERSVGQVHIGTVERVEIGERGVEDTTFAAD